MHSTNPRNTGSLTETLLNAGIDPLDYLDYIPDFFLADLDIKTFSIPGHIRGIGNMAFAGCYHLVEVDIPNSVTSIGNSAFLNCRNLTKITLPPNIKTWGDNIFEGCNKLIDSINGVNYAGDYLVSVEDKSITDLQVQNQTRYIDQGAFENCKNLKVVSLPDSILGLGDRAFQNCSSLEDIVIPNRVQSLNSLLFWNCSNLVQVDLPNSINFIAARVFDDCSKLEVINFKGTLSQWGKIKKDKNWRKGCSVKIISCSDGDIKLA